MIQGTLIAKGIRIGAGLKRSPPRHPESPPAAASDVSAGQPKLWMFIEFEAEEQEAEVMAV